MAKTPHIAVICSPGFSHLFPILEFSKRLLHLHPEFQVTCIIPILESLPSSSKSYLQSLPPNIHSVFLPPVFKHQMPHDAHVGAAQIKLTLTLSLPHILQELDSLMNNNSTSSLVALITDGFAHEALDFATQRKILSFMYLPYNSMVFSLYFSNSTKQIDGSEDSVEIPNCIPPRGRDLPESLRDPLVRKQFFESAKKFRVIDGVLINTFSELETETIRALQEETRVSNDSKPEIFPVGPIIQSGSDETGSDCLKWLDHQESKSVVYVSFGSGGVLSQEQLNELAFGLEQSGQKFLWVVRPPSDDVSAAYLATSNDEKKKNPLDFLPNGFLDRTKDRGLVVPLWAPQVQILSHGSVGGFLSHCGWNSTLESVVHGVPILAWPLFAEQFMNSAFLSDVLKVALWPQANHNGIVEREEIANVVRRFMEGEEGKEIRKRMEELRDGAVNALKQDGSSTKALSQLAETLKAKA